jgi:hypothetical protein
MEAKAFMHWVQTQGANPQVKVQDVDGHIIDEDDDRDGDRYQRRTIMTIVTGGTLLAMSGTDDSEGHESPINMQEQTFKIQ